MHTLSNLTRLAMQLRLPRAWVRAEALAGRLPCLRVGRKLLFTESSVSNATHPGSMLSRPCLRQVFQPEPEKGRESMAHSQ
jgi:hypothetical protein